MTKARKAYWAFVNDGKGEGRRNEFHSGSCEGQRRDRTTVSDVLRAVCRMYGTTVEELKVSGKTRPFTEARAMASLIVQESPHFSLTDLGKALNRDIAPLGRVGRRLRSQATTDDDLSLRVDSLRSEIAKIAERLA